MKRFLVAAALLALTGCATGESLITGQVRPAVDPAAVRVYLEDPPSFEVIGAVQGTSGLGVNGQANLTMATEAAKERAAAMGANGLIIDYMGRPGGASPMIGTVSGGVVTAMPLSDAGDREVRGRAVFVLP